MADLAQRLGPGHVDQRLRRPPRPRLDHPPLPIRPRRGPGARSPAGPGVRRERELRAGLGRTGGRVRVAGSGARHHRGLPGSGLDQRQQPHTRIRLAALGRHAAQVHPRRHARAAVRPPRPKRRQQRHHQPEAPVRGVRLQRHERGLRGRRVRQPPDHRAGPGYRRVQAHVGRVRQHAAGSASRGITKAPARSSSGRCTG